MLPRSTHETFAQKLYQTYKNHKRFAKPKLSRSDFTICHYAGDVCMDCFCIFLQHSLYQPWYESMVLCRSPIKRNYFWTRTKIMLLLSIRLCWVLQNVHLFQAFSLFYLRIPQNLQSFHPLVLGSRWINGLLSVLQCDFSWDKVLIFLLLMCSNNCNLCWKLWVQLSHTTSAV